ncbi:MAG: hypothetical protein M0R18_08960, partial [Deltaproteobacteria bacterium]|nr:hypothetical protein [Deltaproteobacteria bacterium]
NTPLPSKACLYHETGPGRKDELRITLKRAEVGNRAATLSSGDKQTHGIYMPLFLAGCAYESLDIRGCFSVTGEEHREGKEPARQ